MKTMISFQCDTIEEAQAVLTACAAIGKEPHACSKQYMDSKQLLNNTLDLVGVKPAAEDLPPRKNVSPGEPVTTKVSNKIKDEIMEHLKAGGAMGNGPSKYSAPLRLLWARGEIKFDGLSFYI